MAKYAIIPARPVSIWVSCTFEGDKHTPPSSQLVVVTTSTPLHLPTFVFLSCPTPFQTHKSASISPLNFLLSQERHLEPLSPRRECRKRISPQIKPQKTARHMPSVAPKSGITASPLTSDSKCSQYRSNPNFRKQISKKNRQLLDEKIFEKRAWIEWDMWKMSDRTMIALLIWLSREYTDSITIYIPWALFHTRVLTQWLIEKWWNTFSLHQL